MNSPFAKSLPLAIAMQASTIFTAWAAASAPINEAPSIIPLPKEMKVELGKPGYLLPTEEDKATIAPTAYIEASLGKEAYILEVTPEDITITAGDEAGARHAARTLVQSIVKDDNGKLSIPTMTINDAPRFAWRGLMLDSGRYIQRVDDIKKLISIMALYKMNTLHWHLTDDQGWRIEIKAFPKLTEVGSIRPSTPVRGDRKKPDNTPYGGFFTQDQIKEVVTHARANGVTIIPEIEMPGHSRALLTAYPELGNKDIPNYAPTVATTWGVHDYTLAPTEEVFSFIDKVLEEVCALFPDAPFIHIGGDEAPKDQWKKSAQAQAIMKKNNLSNEDELQSYFMRRVETMLTKRGKRIIGWDELLEGGLSPTATMMVWRVLNGRNFAMEALHHGNDIVMCPKSHCYLDYRQGKEDPDVAYEFINADTHQRETKDTQGLDWQVVYAFDPVPAQATPEQAKHVLGCQGNLWTEYIHTNEKMEYMLYPRMQALAEVAWTPKERKDEADFAKRMQHHLKMLDALDVNYRLEDGSAKKPLR